MGFISWIIIGGLAGLLAGKFLGEERQGCLMNIIVGIVGGFLGGLLIGLIGGTGVTGFNLWSLFVSLIGAILFLWLLKVLRK